VLADLERLGKELGTTIGSHRAGSPDLLDALAPVGDRRPRERGRSATAPTEPERSKP